MCVAVINFDILAGRVRPELAHMCHCSASYGEIWAANARGYFSGMCLRKCFASRGASGIKRARSPCSSVNAESSVRDTHALMCRRVSENPPATAVEAIKEDDFVGSSPRSDAETEGAPRALRGWTCASWSGHAPAFLICSCRDPSMPTVTLLARYLFTLQTHLHD